jgi:hypothetical protein
MKIWTLTYNDDNGSPPSDVFLTSEELQIAADEWIQAYRPTYGSVVDFNQPWEDVANALYEQAGFMDSITVQEHDLTPKREGLTRYYVTMTWDDWPEGGSYGDIVWASGYDDAEKQVVAGMIESRGDDTYQLEWHIVDCFPLDDFIQRVVNFQK